MVAVVCVKQVLDPEVPARDFRLDPDTGEPLVPFASRLMGQYDEMALEVALQLRERAGGTAVCALSVGPRAAEEVLRRALGVQADRAVLVEAAGVRGEATAHLLAGAVRRIEGASVVLCGRVSSDAGAGETGPRIAEILGWPVVANVVRIEADGGRLRCWREVEGGYECVAARPPLVATVTNAKGNRPRTPRVRDMMRAYRQPVEVLGPADVGCADLEASLRRQPVRTVRRYVPAAARDCRLIEGETPAEQAHRLAEYLRSVLPDPGAAGGAA